MKTVNLIKIVIYCLLGTGFLSLYMWGCPTYNVWRAGKNGEAELKKATYNRQVKVQEAKAGYYASKWNLLRDTTNARAVALTNHIIGVSLIENQPYLVWYWINALKDIKGHGTVIYTSGMVPMPITEATRLQQQFVSPMPKQ